ncbi:MAG: hypothetical protein M9916_06660 [Crocinitomicaceae bacterium]|nr:hypothetical protein [Crocinitomicaceae bacterium]
MKYIFKPLAVLMIGVALFSCNKREIIPAPTPKVDLKNHFYGKINGTAVELTQNVNGYTGASGVDLIINANALDSAIYHSIFSSSNSSQQVNIAHGCIVFDANASERPSVQTFESFYQSGLNLSPLFNANGLNGFSFSFTDGAGKEWKSKTFGTANYTKMAIESDESGDYAKYKVEFETKVYNTHLDVVTQNYVTDSMTVTDAVYTGWYKR